MSICRKKDVVNASVHFAKYLFSNRTYLLIDYAEIASIIHVHVYASVYERLRNFKSERLLFLGQ